jgi:hypothetical protein
MSEWKVVESAPTSEWKVVPEAPKQDPMKEYKWSNAGDVWNNIMVRPGAGVRNVLRGGGFMEGFSDPNQVQSFQGQALDKFYESGFLSEHPMIKEALGVGVSAVGLAADVATNPADLLAMFIGKAPIKGTGTTLAGEVAGSKVGQTVGRMANVEINRPADVAKLVNPRLTETPGALERVRSIQSTSKALSEQKKILPIDDTISIKEGVTNPALKEGMNLIKKTSNPRDVANKFRIEKDGIIRKVDELVAQNNREVKPAVVESRARLLLEKEFKNFSKLKKDKLETELKEQLRWMNEQDAFDTVKANARKRFLYEETQGLQGKQARNQTVIRSPERDLVKDKISQALKEQIEQAHPDIQKFNSRYDGLNQGLDAAAKMADAIEKKGGEGLTISTQTVGRPNPEGMVSAAVREIPKFLKRYGSVTGRIEKFSGKAAEQLAISRRLQGERLIGAFLNKQKMDMPNVDYFRKLLTVDDVYSFMSKPKQLTSPARTFQPLDVKEQGLIEGRTVGGRKQLPEPEKFKRTRLASWER